MQEKETLNTLNCDSFEHTKPTSGFMPEFEFLHLRYLEIHILYSKMFQVGFFLSNFHLCYSLPMWDLVMVSFVNIL